jgi:hypothetical protein
MGSAQAQIEYYLVNEVLRGERFGGFFIPKRPLPSIIPAIPTDKLLRYLEDRTLDCEIRQFSPATLTHRRVRLRKLH